MIDCIIFSKDRACQLELLLRSLKSYVDLSDFKIKIIYTYSNEIFQKAYEKLIKSANFAIWILEKDKKFKEITIENIQEEYVMFLVDDICFINSFSTKSDEFQNFTKNEDILTLSLRLSPNINFCYAVNRKSGTPSIKNGTWEWKNGSGDWCYPNSIDGNIFRKKDIIDGLPKIDFWHPSSLESRLGNHIRILGKKLMSCFPQQKLVNLPLNMIDPSNTNRSLNIKTSELNDKFLSNKRISFETLKGIPNNMCHVEIKKIVFEEDTNG